MLKIRRRQSRCLSAIVTLVAGMFAAQPSQAALVISDLSIADTSLSFDAIATVDVARTSEFDSLYFGFTDDLLWLGDAIRADGYASTVGTYE